jgi:hypothetical protein
LTDIDSDLKSFLDDKFNSRFKCTFNCSPQEGLQGVGQIPREVVATALLQGIVGYFNSHYFNSFQLSLQMDEGDEIG